MVDPNLFLYDLAIVAIFKNEARYLKEWLDYHLLAGVEHFYLYNNDSTDNYKEVLAPYVEKNLVTLTECPGNSMQYPAYEDAINKYRFECRYMAFIDIDEFIFPKTNQNIVKVIDEILSKVPNAVGLGINWQIFGSNGQEKADYSLGVLERFTRRAPSDWPSNDIQGNHFIKTILNPRFTHYVTNPHYAFYFSGKCAVNSNSEPIKPWYDTTLILSDKIVINHYFMKSKEEYLNNKQRRGFACSNEKNPYSDGLFNHYDRNEVLDDSILKYRAARADNFSFESDEQRVNRVISAVFKNLNQSLTEDTPSEFFVDKLETFLTCRAVTEKFQIKIGNNFAEEYALAWIYQTLIKTSSLAEIQMFLKALPEILPRPFPVCKQIYNLVQNSVLPNLCATLKMGDITNGESWKARSNWLYVQQLLSLIKL